jgi:hypothetical protein
MMVGVQAGRVDRQTTQIHRGGRAEKLPARIVTGSWSVPSRLHADDLPVFEVMTDCDQNNSAPSSIGDRHDELLSGPADLASTELRRESHYDHPGTAA